MISSDGSFVGGEEEGEDEDGEGEGYGEGRKITNPVSDLRIST